MSDLEVISHEILRPEDSLINKPDLQTASDAFFTERARLSVPGKLGEWALADHQLVDRPDNDPTLLDNKFFSADMANRPYAEHVFLRKVGNLKNVLSKLNHTIDKHGLKDHSNITIVMPHVVMQDAATLPILIGQSSLGEGRTIEDNYIIISRLIPYINYLNPIKQLVNRVVPSVDATPANAFDKLVKPVGNVVQIFPETESTKPLFEKYALEIGRYNVRALREMREHQDSRACVAKQQIKFVPPNASRTKKEGDKNDKIYAMEYVSRSTVRMLYKDHKKGIPIWPIGINYSPAMIYLPGFPPQDIKLHSVKPIMPDDDYDVRRLMNEETFEQLLLSSLVQSAQKVVKHPVYQKPRP